MNEKQSCYELQMINVRYVSDLSIVGQNSEPVPFVFDLITVTPTADGTVDTKAFCVIVIIIINSATQNHKEVIMAEGTNHSAQLFSPW